jgi:predicted O-linked N-acetylglucosamine transferase (SPINDLY family)
MKSSAEGTPDAMTIEAAVERHRAGDLLQAERMYRVLLRTRPGDAGLLHLLGVLQLQCGEPIAAIKLIYESLNIDSRQPVAYLNLGIAMRKSNRLVDALECFERALQLAPDYAEALVSRGDLLLAVQRPSEALQCLERALRLRPNDPLAWNNHGNALRALQRPEEALSSYEAALKLEPQSPTAWNNRGSALCELHRHDDGLRSFEQALRIAPDHEDALYNQGNALLQLARYREALEKFERLLRFRPDDADVLTHRGIALMEQQRHEEARSSLEQALALRPGLAPALINLGNVLQRLHRTAEALLSFEQVLRAEPDNILALNNRGNALVQLRQFEDAMRCFDRALLLSPNCAELYHNRGNASRAMGRFEQSELDFRRALSLKPDYADVLFSYATLMMRLGRLAEAAPLLAKLREVHADYPYARGAEFLLRAQLCDWEDAERQRARLVARALEGAPAAVPFALLAATDSPAALLQCARTNARERYPPRAEQAARVHTNGARVRLAYVSGDLRNHAVAHLLVGVLEHHDRRLFEVNAISLRSAQSDPVGKRVRCAFDRFIDATMRSDDEIATLMRAMEVDVAIDLAGYTEGNRLGIFARRAAPVQVAYLGYAGTIGAPYMDYLLADAVTVPPGEEHWYAEQIVRLPGCCLPTDDCRPVGTPPSRRDAGLPQEGFVFCAFTNSYKINAPIFDIWMRLLTAAPGSVLWLRAMAYEAQENLRRQAQRRRVEATRLVFAPRVEALSGHLARLSLADLCLDTLPYNAHSTACDALWAGVPVLSCAGQSFASRVGASVLTAAGLAELIAENPADYESKALELARNRELLQSIRRRLEARRTDAALFDTTRYTRQLEAAYLTMTQGARRGQAPAAFDVVPHLRELNRDGKNA